MTTQYQSGLASLFATAARSQRFEFHYMYPEKLWGVFENGTFVAMFGTSKEAQEYCARHNGEQS